MSHGPTEKYTSASEPAGHEPSDSKAESPTSQVTRSASYAELPIEQPPAFPERTDSLRRSFSENVLANGIPSTERRSSTSDPPTDSPTLERAGSLKSAHPIVPQFSLGDEQVTDEHQDSAAVYDSEHEGSQTSVSPQSKEVKEGKTSAERPRARRSVSGSISNFARRRSWINTSRSPSPSPGQRRPQRMKEPRSHPENYQEQSWPLPEPVETEKPSSRGLQTYVTSLARKNSLLGRRGKRPLSSLLGRDSLDDVPSLPPVPKSFSTDRLPSLNHKRSNPSEAPPLPRTTSYDKFPISGTESPRKKDELWSVFRTLDGEYSKFQSRPSTTKAVAVRSSLLPFLRAYAEHPSTATLKPEDLDRRSVILNKWWTGLLEMLNGRHGESVSGNDRPAILEAVTALMLRPEWTASPSAVQSRIPRGPRASLKSRSTTSLGSNISDFLVDSVFHNIKNIFTQNLLAQMAYVVQKMSMRNVAASVVNFCGKATAYAFFYCDGVAAILVRLWALPTDTLRRVLAEYGLARIDRLDAVCDRVCLSYPSCIHPLGFRSLQSTTRYLRSRPHLPIATNHIPWHGPWIGRWAGKDTDLFFFFVKHFTDLLSRYMPDGVTTEEQIALPAWALVQAQVLTVMRNIVQRSSHSQPTENPRASPPTTFEDMIGEADATATLLPLPANGVIRSMAENRLIMLLRDCLANSTLMTDKAREMFADMFNRLLKATAQHTSVFDHNACFTLCDFLEEAMVILMRHAQPASSGLDWEFWLQVCKGMLLSQNTMTEVRLFAFLFSMWGYIIKDDEIRRQFCLDWLLSKDTFHAEFNHWCPMVRAFFMRLLIWKIARPSAENTKLNNDVLHSLCTRLEEVWHHFLYIEQYAESIGQAKSSTIPCSPAPSRQLLIVRDDVQAAPGGMFLSFDGILSSVEKARVNPYEKHSSQDSIALGGSIDSMANGDETSSIGGKNKWTLLKSIIPFSSSSSNLNRKASPKPTTNKPPPNGPPRPKTSDHLSPTGTFPPETPALPSYRSLSFKFSLEWADKTKTSAVNKERARHLTPPRLPPLAEEAYRNGFRRQQQADLYQPHRPEGSAIATSKYAGRAIAEWGLLIAECRRFFDRRKAEGVPALGLVEVPSLSVAPFRKL